MQSIRSLALRAPRSYCVKGTLLARQMATSPTVAPEQDSTKHVLRVMPLGGSITYGVGSSDGNGYRKALQDILGARGYRIEMVGSRTSGSMNNSANEGWPGRRIDQIRGKAIKSTAQFLPDIFLVNAGSNDCLQDHQIDSAHARLDALLEDLWRVGSPDATVILSTLVMAADPTVNERVLRVNEQIRELVSDNLATEVRRVVLADMYSSDGGLQLADLGPDGVHPNNEGYVKMARVWEKSYLLATWAGFIPS
ncbi:SGNH hydrolase-type esterase domain-containing protein [Aspergillus pseudoustus]|uniref:SGNH hydrolase-type esterase domain-containing protein n=1 Tax=Aspergillus pseudoustus TaxID=1810923 RepID=A0ABR4ISC6_9EURO